MSNRVLLTPEGLKVSKPGVNVETTGMGGLQFNSDWATPRVLQKGSVYLPNNGQQLQSSISIPLARGFHSPPMFFFGYASIWPDGYPTPSTVVTTFPAIGYINKTFIAWDDQEWWYGLEVWATTSHLIISAWAQSNYDIMAGPSIRYDYAILDHRL